MEGRRAVSTMKSLLSQFGAVGLALAGYTLWVVADTSLKFLGASSLPSSTIIALVGLSIIFWLGLFGLMRRNIAALWPKRPARQVLRSLLDLGNNFCVVIALRHLPLALFYILVFFAPMVTTLLAAIFLGERLEWKRGVAILTGFVGVVVAVQPFGITRVGDWTGYLACGVCVACFSTNMVWSRVMVRTESLESLTFTSAAVMAFAGCLASVHRSISLPGTLLWVFIVTGLVCVVGNFCFFLALRHTTASVVSQFHYSQLLTGAAIGYLIWREAVTAPMLAGAVLIIGSGLYTAARSYNAPAEMEAIDRSL